MARNAGGMEYLATILRAVVLKGVKQPITPHRPVKTALGGYFRQGIAYTNWRPHGSGDWLLIYTVAGTGLITTTTGPLRLHAGSAVLFQPGEAQDYRTDPDVGEWALRWAHFQPRPAWRAWLHWPKSANGAASVSIEAAELRDAINRSLARLVDLVRHGWLTTDDLAMNALEEALLWFEAGASQHGRWRIDSRVRQAMDYLAAHVDKPFHLSTLARHCGLSVSRLSHLFKAETGVTLQQHSEELRIREAQQLLSRTSLPLKAIANATGFSDAYYFSKRFRRHTGTTPTAWRAAAGKPRA